MARLNNVRIRHQVHPSLDFCAVCGITPVPSDGKDCPEEMTAERKLALAAYLEEHGYEFAAATPGYITKTGATT